MNSTLEDMKIKGKATVVVMFRLKGGPGPLQLARAMSEHKSGLRDLPGFVKLCTQECMILLIEPDQGQHHAKLMCGHVISKLFFGLILLITFHQMFTAIKYYQWH